MTDETAGDTIIPAAADDEPTVTELPKALVDALGTTLAAHAGPDILALAETLAAKTAPDDYTLGLPPAANWTIKINP